MSTRRRVCLLVAAVALVRAVQSAPDDTETLPTAAAHKQIIYRYIPIDKSFLGLDKAYDDYYRTGTPYEEYTPGRRREEYSSHEKDSYYYNHEHDRSSSGHRRRDDNHHSNNRRPNDVDSYTTYSRADHRGHDHRRNDDYYNYDYDYSQDYSSDYHSGHRRPSKRRQKPERQSSGAKTAIDFIEAIGRRVFALPKSWTKSLRQKSGSGGGGHKGGGSRKKFSISFDSVITFMSYLLGAGLLLGYISLVVINAVASDGLSLEQIFSRSLAGSTSGAVNNEALRLLMLLETGLNTDEADDCSYWQLCQLGQQATWRTLKNASSALAVWTSPKQAGWLATLAELLRPNHRCGRLYPDCAAAATPEPSAEPAEQ